MSLRFGTQLGGWVSNARRGAGLAALLSGPLSILIQINVPFTHAPVKWNFLQNKVLLTCSALPGEERALLLKPFLTGEPCLNSD